MIAPSDYLTLYNGAFDKAICIEDIDASRPLLPQLMKLNNDEGVNHYMPVNYLAKNSTNIIFSNRTILAIERLFDKLNSLF